MVGWTVGVVGVSRCGTAVASCVCVLAGDTGNTDRSRALHRVITLKSIVCVICARGNLSDGGNLYLLSFMTDLWSIQFSGPSELLIYREHGTLSLPPKRRMLQLKKDNNLYTTIMSTG
jgi:hypothetical protein